MVQNIQVSFGCLNFAADFQNKIINVFFFPKVRRHTGHDRTDKEYITNCFARRQRRRRRAFTSRARRFFDTCENAAVVVRLRCVLFWSRATYSRERKKKSNLHMGRFERDRERERGAWVGFSRPNGELFWGGSRKDFQQAIAVSGWGLCLQKVGENANWQKKKLFVSCDF